MCIRYRVTPVRYFMEPEVIPLETIIDREKKQTIDDAKETESWYCLLYTSIKKINGLLMKIAQY